MTSWPRRWDAGDIRFGPPKFLSSASKEWPDQSGDGKVKAIVGYNGAWVRFSDRPDHGVWLGPHPSANRISVRHDGRLVATGSHHGNDVKVWEAGSGKLVKTLIEGKARTHARFSPDGRWLATDEADGPARLWEVDSWRERPIHPEARGLAALGPDGRLLAVTLGNRQGVIGLFDLATGNELARLTDPGRYGSWPLFFSADGGQLFCLADYGEALVVWDLRAIREQLAELELDWELPAYPRALSSGEPAPTQVEFIGADLAASPQRLAEYEASRAVADLFFNPFDPDAHERLGRHCLTRKQFAAAFSHLGVALALAPSRKSALLHRAEAAFSLGRWAEAEADYTRHLDWQPDDRNAHHQRGHARDYQGKFALAIEDFSEAIRRLPGEAHLHESRGISRVGAGDVAGAIADYEQALKIDPQHAPSQMQLAVVLANGPKKYRNPRRAIELASRAMAAKPGNHVYMRTLGLALYRADNIEQALAPLIASLEGNRIQPTPALYLLAMCYARRGDPEDAKDYLDRANKSWDERNTSDKHTAQKLAELREEATAEVKKAQQHDEDCP